MPRSTGSATIAFGVVNVPVKFYVAAQAEDIAFNMITPKGNKIKRPTLDAVTGEEVPFADLDKGYEVAKGEYVTFKAAELKALEAECEAKAVEIQEFVSAVSLDPLWIEKTYYLGPDKGADKAYMLLSEAMQATATVGVAQWNARGKEHLVILRPYKGGLVLHQMFYDNEVRDFTEIEFATKSGVSTAERDMACKLVTAYSSGDFDPTKYANGYKARVLAAVEQKKSGGTILAASAQGSAPAASVLDLGSLLQASLEAASKRKPAKVTPIGKGKKKP